MSLLGRDGRVAKGGALLRRWTSRPRGFESHSLRFSLVWPINIWSGCAQVRGAGGRGRVAEWLKAHDWKSCGLTPAWVRIPPRPCWDDPFRFRGVAQSGRALRSGRRGPRFESGRPD